MVELWDLVLGVLIFRFYIGFIEFLLSRVGRDGGGRAGEGEFMFFRKVRSFGEFIGKCV